MLTTRRGLAGPGAPPRPLGGNEGGFTLIEMMVVVVIIAVVAALALVGVSKGMKTAREGVERQILVSARTAVEQYKQAHGFVPHLVMDDAPIVDNDPAVYLPESNAMHREFLRRENPPNPEKDERFSVLSLPYYLIGVLGEEVDGKDGPGFTRPERDGDFTRRGRTIDPLYDVSRDAARLARDPMDPNRVVLLDRWGVKSDEGWLTESPFRTNALRYYRWVSDDAPAGALDLNVPPAVGNVFDAAVLRDAAYAIVSVGPDGEVDDTNYTTAGELHAANKDNLVEVGR